MKRPFASVEILSADISQRTRDLFSEKFDRAGDDECWEWTAYKTAQGYGRFRSTTAQRVAYAIFVGDLPAGLTVDHLCHNRGCVNPRHLEAVPHVVNVLRSNGVTAMHARATHCKKGHPLVRGRTQRFCIVCKRDRDREWMRRYRAEQRQAA